jgi:hypothetical protein
MGLYVQNGGRWAEIKMASPPPSPTLIDLLFRFEAAAAKWAAAGFPWVSRDEFKARLKLCRQCPHWRRSLVPTCQQCGCTALKLWLATEECPLTGPEKRWKATFKAG